MVLDNRGSAALALQKLTLSDPAASANMLRHLGATRLLLTGMLEDAPELRLIPAAGFDLTEAAAKRLSDLVQADGNDRLWITFDVDDGLGAPIGIDLFHRRKGSGRVVRAGCRLWLPEYSGPVSLVYRRINGFARYEPGPKGVLRRCEGPPVGDVEDGVRRAAARLGRAIDSPQVREFAARTAFRFILD